MTAEIVDTDAGRDRLREVAREAFATTRRQRGNELRRVAVREAVDMLRDGATRAEVAAYVLDSVLGDQAHVAGIRTSEVAHRWRVECACGFVVEHLRLTDADVLAARHADAECAPDVLDERRLP